MRRSMGRRGNQGNTTRGGGPLITGHLKDIDLELELLKRKREMIEQQQQLLVMEQQFKSSRNYESYDQMRYDKPVQHGSNRDFTQLYDNEPKNRNQFGRKRQPDVQWQYENSFKRIQAKRKNNPPQFNQHGPGNANIRNQRPVPNASQGPKSSPKRPAPLMGVKIKQSTGQRIANQKPPSKTPNKDFTLTKSFKSKAPPAPNKLASQPLTERKRLVATANELVADGDVSRMLLPDRVPTQQVSGRLELALGAIMKNIRELTPIQHFTTLRSAQLQRVMKQAIRERIRTVMLGKVVGSLLDILAVYREEFPEETDIDIVNIALEAGGLSGISGTPAKEKEEKPELPVPVTAETDSFAFKRNLNIHLKNQLHEMFDKMHEIYNTATAEPEASSEAPAESAANSETTAEPAAVSETPAEPAAVTETPAEPAAVTETPAEPVPNSETQAEPAPNNETPAEPAPNSGTSAEPAPNSETPAEPAANIETPKEQSDPQKNSDIKKEKQEITDYEFLNTDIKVRDVKRILPRLMRKCIPYIIKLMDVAPFKFSASEVNKMPNNVPGDGQGDGNIVAVSAATSGPRQAYNLPYYVKIMGRPSLPKRKVMQTFLTQFNPKSVKKHRTIHNLLFVGFTEQTDYDAMVAADGTVIGRSTLSVRICSKGAQESTNGQNGATNKTDSETNFAMDINPDEIKKDVEIISDDLDDQITDLLSTIRKSEEEESKETVGKTGEEIVNKSEDLSKQNESDEIKTEEANEDAEMNEIKNAETAKDDNNTETGDDKDAIVNATEETTGDEKNASEENEPKTGNVDVTNKTELINNVDNQKDSQPPSEGNSVKAGEQCEDDKVGDLKDNPSGTSTPSRTSARLANVTPSTVRTRRASRLAQN